MYCINSIVPHPIQPTGYIGNCSVRIYNMAILNVNGKCEDQTRQVVAIVFALTSDCLHLYFTRIFCMHGRK